MIRRRRFVFGAAATFGIARAARADQRVTVLVGGQSQSPADAQARLFLPFLAEHLSGSDIQISNVSGDAGLAAVLALAKAPANGTVLGWVATPTLPARIVDRHAPDLMDSITLLGAIEREPISIVATTATQISSVEDLIARAQTNPAAVPFGTPPPGSPPHLAMLRLQSLAEVALNIVVFPTAAEARQAAVTGHVAAASLGLTSAIDDLRAGRLTGLGIAADNQATAFPDMPPLRDSGVDLSAAIQRGLAVPAGLPDDISHRLISAMKAVAADTEFHGRADDRGFVATWVDGDSWAVELNDDRARLARLWAKHPWPLGNEG